MRAKNRVRSSKISPGKKNIFKGEKDVFLDQKETEEEIDKNEVEVGVNCKMVGAAKAKERRPLAERMSGTISRCLFVDLRFLVGV